MTKIESRPDHRTPIGEGTPGPAHRLFGLFFDDLVLKLNARLLGKSIVFESYTVAQITATPPVPDPTLQANLNGVIIVSDETGGRTIATSDGTDWRRVSDGAIVS